MSISLSEIALFMSVCCQGSSLVAQDQMSNFYQQYCQMVCIFAEAKLYFLLLSLCGAEVERIKVLLAEVELLILKHDEQEQY